MTDCLRLHLKPDHLVGKLSEVKIQVSEPLREPGDEIEFLKRKYVLERNT